MSKLLRLKRLMAAAHPDHGGTSEAFIRAHRQYIAEKRLVKIEAKFEAWRRKNEADAAERKARQKTEWEQYLARVAKMTGPQREMAERSVRDLQARVQRREQVDAFVTKALKYRRQLVGTQRTTLDWMQRGHYGWSVDPELWTEAKWRTLARIWRRMRRVDPNLRAGNSFEIRLDTTTGSLKPMAA